MSADKMDGVLTLNPEQGKRAIALCWEAERLARKKGVPIWVPVVLVGPTSTAKTATIRGFVEMINQGYDPTDAEWSSLWLTHVSTLVDSSDIAGAPHPTADKTGLEYLLPKYLPFVRKDQKAMPRGVWALDEADRTRDESLQNSFLNILNGREVHGHVVSPDVFVIGTMNGTSDSGTAPLCEAFRGRVCTLFFASRSPGLIESYEGWAAGKISPVGMTFSRYRRELLRDDPVFEEIAIPVQRTVDMADLVLQASKGVRFDVSDVLMPVIAGLVGRKAAAEFMATEKLISEAPSVKAIMADPDKCDVPENPSACYALCVTLADHGKTVKDRTELNKVSIYGARMRAEFGALLFKRLSKESPAIVTTPDFQKWAKEHKALLI